MEKLIPHSQPVVIREKTGSGDLAAIIQAASKSTRELSSVEYRQNEAKFTLEAHHIAYTVGMVCIVVFALVFLLAGVPLGEILFSEDGAIWRWSFGMSALSGLTTGAILLWYAAARLNNFTEYYIAYEASSEGLDVRHHKTFKIELKNKNRLQYVNLPEWFTERHLLKLSQLAKKDGFQFNRPTLEHTQIATQSQYPELRDSMIDAALLERFGRGYKLSEAFSELVYQVEND